MIAISADGTVFTDYEYELIDKAFRLPLFNRGTLCGNGYLKGNRTLARVSYNNLITNPIFVDTSNWIQGSKWSISNGKAICNDPGGIYLGSLEINNLGLEENAKYKLAFKVSDYISGALQARINWNVAISTSVNQNYLCEMEFTYTKGTIPTHEQVLLLRPIEGIGFSGSVEFVELVKI